MRHYTRYLTKNCRKHRLYIYVHNIQNEEMHATAEIGRNPASKHQIQPEYGGEQADAGRDS